MKQLWFNFPSPIPGTVYGIWAITHFLPCPSLGWQKLHSKKVWPREQSSFSALNQTLQYVTEKGRSSTKLKRLNSRVGWLRAQRLPFSSLSPAVKQKLYRSAAGWDCCGPTPVTPHSSLCSSEVASQRLLPSPVPRIMTQRVCPGG